MRFLKKSLKGQTLIEVLIALSVAVVIVSALTVVVTASLNNAQFSSNQNLTTKFATEGMEFVRRVRNSDYVGFGAYPTGMYCLPTSLPATLGSPAGSCLPNINNNTFVREVLITQASPNCPNNQTLAEVRVLWTDGKCVGGTYCHSSKLNSCFSTVSPYGNLDAQNLVDTPTPTSVFVPPTPTFTPAPTPTPIPGPLTLNNRSPYVPAPGMDLYLYCQTVIGSTFYATYNSVTDQWSCQNGTMINLLAECRWQYPGYSYYVVHQLRPPSNSWDDCYGY